MPPPSLSRSLLTLNPFPRRAINEIMSSEPEKIVLVYLRRIDEKVDRLLGDVQDLKHRVTSLGGHVESIHGDMAAMSLRIDRIETRLDRIERRLDPVSAPTS
jgi:tetrahydromethanopterin S-methyltransferase subunit B